MSNEKHSVFICYRHSDSHPIAKFLYDDISGKLGRDRVFLAPETIDGGEKWPPAITSALEAAKVMLVLIGHEWLRVQNEYGQRLLDLPDDWVVREIRMALERQIPIIPVLLDGAKHPPEEALPSDIKKLFEHQPLQIRRGASQALEPEDVHQLHHVLEQRLPAAIKGLHPYEASDWAIFQRLQRERELEECLKALANPEVRVGVLYGRTGCGKTSFLKAGVIPALGRPHANSPIGIHVQFTHQDDPFITLRKNLQAQLQLSASSLQELDLPSWFNQVAATRLSPIVLLFDQFEEFLHSERGVRAKFVDGLTHWYEHQSALPLKILFTVHSPDHLGPLFTQIRCYNLCQFGLGPFTNDQAFASLKTLAEADGMAFDESFVRARILRDILGPEADGILPLQLQIVAWAINRPDGNNLGFTEAGYNAIGSIKGSLDRLLFKELRLLPEQDQETLLWILDSLIDRDTKRRRSPLTANEISNMLPVQMSKDVIERKLKWLTKERLVWSKDEKDEKDENVVRCYELAHWHLIEPVMKMVDDKFSDVRAANDLLDSHVRYYRTKHRFRRLKVKDCWLIRKVMQQNKIRWGSEEQKKDKKTIIKKSQQSAIAMIIVCLVLMVVMGVLGYGLVPESAETKIRRSVEIALSNSHPNDPPNLLTMETLIMGIAVLGKWEEWENKAKDYPEAKADFGRSELSLFTANQKLWGQAEKFAASIKNSEVKAVTFAHLAKESEQSQDPERQNGFIQDALNAIEDMPERAERVHVLYDLQRRVPDSASVNKVKDRLNEETKKVLAQIESRIEEQPTPKESKLESLRLREKVRLLALAAEVESYAGEPTTIKKKLEDAKAVLTKINDDRDRSIAFHLLIEGTATCLLADPNGIDFYKTYLTTLGDVFPKSTSLIEPILGRIEASAIILRATPPPPVAAMKLAREFLSQAEDLASTLRRDHRAQQQLSEQKIPSPASFLLREVRTLELAHTTLLSKYMVEPDDMRKEPSIALVLKIQEHVKAEMPQKESVGPERLDLLLTQLAVARAFAQMNKSESVKEALRDARKEAEKLYNPHQKSAVLRAIVEIAAGISTGARTDNASAAPDKDLMNFARQVLDDESLDPSDKGWASASYAIGLARQVNNAWSNPTGAIERGMNGGSWMPPIPWKFFGGCPNRGVFSDSIMTVPNQKGPARNFALHGIARELAKAQYLDCVLKQLNDVSDANLRTSGYAEILLDDSKDITALPKFGVLALLDQVSPDQDRFRSQDKVASMRLVPGGYFIMGTAYRDIDQSPPHYVHLNTFYIDEHEVTVAQYEKFYSTRNEPRFKPQTEWSDETVRKYGMKPVIGITYEQATWFCEWADKRLPTEAEWEKAARGTYFRSGEQNIFPWGSELPDKDTQEPGMLRAHYDIRKNWTGYEDLKNVRDIAWTNTAKRDRGNEKGGQKNDLNPGNSPYQVIDMAGSVWEWVKDWHSASYYSHSSPEDPQGPPAGIWRVLRGGSWDNKEGQLEATYRLYKDPPYYYSTIGFRCAK